MPQRVAVTCNQPKAASAIRLTLTFSESAPQIASRGEIPKGCRASQKYNLGTTRFAYYRAELQKASCLKGKVVRPERVELPTFWFVAKRSIQLSYGRTEF